MLRRHRPTHSPVLGQIVPGDDDDDDEWDFWRDEEWWADVLATAAGLTIGAILGALIARQIGKSG